MWPLRAYIEERLVQTPMWGLSSTAAPLVLVFSSPTSYFCVWAGPSISCFFTSVQSWLQRVKGKNTGSLLARNPISWGFPPLWSDLLRGLVLHAPRSMCLLRRRDEKQGEAAPHVFLGGGRRAPLVNMKIWWGLLVNFRFLPLQNTNIILEVSLSIKMFLQMLLLIFVALETIRRGASCLMLFCSLISEDSFIVKERWTCKYLSKTNPPSSSYSPNDAICTCKLRYHLNM